MKILKGLALGLLASLLFLSLSIFGWAFTLNSTILNPNFITAELDRIDVPSLAEEILSEQMLGEELPEELTSTLLDTIDRLESPVKEQLNATIHAIYDYLLGKKESPELALTLGNTFFNSDFVVSLMDTLDVPSLIEEFTGEQITEDKFPEEFQSAVVNTVTELEPLIKEQVSAASDPVFDYLLGKSQSIDLTQTLRNTFLSSDFFISLLNELNISSLATEFLSEQLVGQIPEEMEFLVEQLDEYLDEAIAELEPTIKEELSASAVPISDYLLGISQSLRVEISLEPVMESLKEPLREALLESLPPGLAGLPQSTLDQYFEEFFAEFTEIIPATIELDETLIPPEIPAQIAEALAEAEDGLEQARQDIADVLVVAEEVLVQAREYVSYFQLGYKLLIAFIILLIAGIILLNREVRSSTRKLGSAFLTYGILWFAGILVAKYFTRTQIAKIDIPSSYLKELLPQLVSDFAAPLQMLSLGLLIGGIVLIVVSFVYPKWRQSA